MTPRAHQGDGVVSDLHTVSMALLVVKRLQSLDSFRVLGERVAAGRGLGCRVKNKGKGGEKDATKLHPYSSSEMNQPPPPLQFATNLKSEDFEAVSLSGSRWLNFAVVWSLYRKSRYPTQIEDPDASI
ncbi:hypothetical protein BKA70DRAFT_1233628 [Coprinopsis sp. MPI-PUGE-AT-0042]|nr:hypothetical protein BKA70DRAFT_1233628 [Coprinopsis sp. MPI-PUGE-AT-0042]